MRKVLILIYLLTCTISCIDHNDFSTPKSLCIEDGIKANATFADIKALYNDEIVQIQDDLIIEGYVVSSDEAGNFFGTLHIQDSPSNPTEGFQIDIDTRDSHLFYRVGEKIYIKLSGLYLDESNDIYKVGGVFRNAGGTLSVGRLPAAKVKEHVFNACDPIQTLTPKNISIMELNDKLLNTFILLENLELAEENLMQAYAIPGEYTDRVLKNCDGNTIVLRNSGYADFQSEILPEGNGYIVGVLGKYRNDYQLIIRDLDDVSFNAERCNSIANSQLMDILAIRNMYSGSSKITLHENIKIKAVVTSDKDSGNLESNKVIVQDATAGIELNFMVDHSLDLADEIEIVIMGAELEKLNGSLQLSNISIENIISKSKGTLPTPQQITLDEAISEEHESKLVSIDEVQFSQLGETYEGTKLIMDCKNIFEVITHANASFADDNIHEQNGRITGIIRINKTPFLHLRNTSDVNFVNPYIDCYANDVFVFISELADPDNNSSARFVELYNSANETIDLTGWQLRRFTNANTEVSSAIDLSGHVINAKSTFIIAANATEFTTVYGFEPDIPAGTNGPADSNGDDNLELVNSIGTIIDVFGVQGEDGSSTNHEFEDGKAVRNPEITRGNPVYTYSEWTVYNDTGDAGTINLPQQAPDDFTPGVR